MDCDAWVTALIAPDNKSTAARKIGVPQSTISRQLEKDRLKPEMIIRLCRVYGRSPVTGLIENGYINPWESESISVPYALQQATNSQLLAELLRRSDADALQLFTTVDTPSSVYES